MCVRVFISELLRANWCKRYMLLIWKLSALKKWKQSTRSIAATLRCQSVLWAGRAFVAGAGTRGSTLVVTNTATNHARSNKLNYKTKPSNRPDCTTNNRCSSRSELPQCPNLRRRWSSSNKSEMVSLKKSTTKLDTSLNNYSPSFPCVVYLQTMQKIQQMSTLYEQQQVELLKRKSILG